MATSYAPNALRSGALTDTLKAIYRLEGDTLKVCVNEAKRGERPREFGAKEGSHAAVVSFMREKK